MAQVTAIVDAHVHIHACYDIDEFFDHAYRNLSRARPRTADSPSAFYLMLTECADDNYFDALRQLALGATAEAAAGAQGLHLRRWAVATTSEDESLVVSEGGRRLILVAGRQVACKEGLEGCCSVPPAVFRIAVRSRKYWPRAQPWACLRSS